MPPEQYAADVAAYNAAWRAHNAAHARAERERAVGLRLTHYEWLAVDVHGTCDVAKRNGGKVFSYADPSPDGHPCEGHCTSPDWCRCKALPQVTGFG